jgi:hypothetical protein
VSAPDPDIKVGSVFISKTKKIIALDPQYSNGYYVTNIITYKKYPGKFKEGVQLTK